eukprot:3201898-Amphidinium_carterae.1
MRLVLAATVLCAICTHGRADATYECPATYCAGRQAPAWCGSVGITSKLVPVALCPSESIIAAAERGCASQCTDPLREFPTVALEVFKSTVQRVNRAALQEVPQWLPIKDK